VLSHVSKRLLFIQSDHESKSGETQVRVQDKDKLKECLLDQVGAWLLVLIVTSMVDANLRLGVMLSGVAVLMATCAVWRRSSKLAGIGAGVVVVVVTLIAGVSVVCGVLALVAYYAVPLWCLSATLAQRVLDVVEFSDSWKQALRELPKRVLKRIFKRA
jgi:hypothetical protein